LPERLTAGKINLSVPIDSTDAHTGWSHVDRSVQVIIVTLQRSARKLTMPAEIIPLPDLPRELAVLTGAAPPPTYRRCYDSALNGLFPTLRQRGRHFVRRADLPEIGRALGLAVPVAPLGVAPRKPGTRPLLKIHSEITQERSTP
jgi:hypothetical protein